MVPMIHSVCMLYCMVCEALLHNMDVSFLLLGCLAILPIHVLMTPAIPSCCDL